MNERSETWMELADFLLGDEYRPLLWRAIYMRVATVVDPSPHLKAISLLEAAFPEEAS